MVQNDPAIGRWIRCGNVLCWLISIGEIAHANRNTRPILAAGRSFSVDHQERARQGTHMVRRRRLIKQFEAARRKGWNVGRADFPEAVAEPFFPARDKLFRALEQFSPEDVRFLILGQDPYATPDANGIAFSVERIPQEDPLPPSLRRIMGHVYAGGGGRPSLDDWIAEKKILLLNSALTVPAPNNGARGHLHLWHAFTRSILVQLIQHNPNVKLVAWGAPARKLMCAALEESGAFASCAHPSRPNESFEKFWQSSVGNSLCMKATPRPGEQRQRKARRHTSIAKIA
jgi:uracil DNA glycosylase